MVLQEVDHFDFLSRALATQSYSGIFVPKPDSPCVYIKDNNGPDGCAIFYKNDKFDLVEKHDKILQVWTVQSNQVKLIVITFHIGFIIFYNFYLFFLGDLIIDS